MNHDEKIVFVGAGLSSLLMSAYMIRKGINPADILIVEKSGEAGGQFTSRFTHGQLFDSGMHIYYETGIQEIDSIFLGILPYDQWHFLVGNRKDVAGIFWNNKLQIQTPYPDLRRTQFSIIRSLFSILSQWIKRRRGKVTSAEEWFTSQFGGYLSRTVFKPMVEKLYKLPYQELDAVVSKLTALNRVTLFGEALTRLVMKSGFLRSRIAYPEQRNLPDIRKNYGRGIYPKRFGMGLVVESLADKLRTAGVSIVTNASIDKVFPESNQKKIARIEVRNLVTNETNLIKSKHILWMTVPVVLPQGMHARTDIKFDAASTLTKKYFVNLVLGKAPRLADLYYVYVFDSSSEIFRITNYAAYCPHAVEANSGYPITVEFWSSTPVDENEILQRVTEDLVKLGICNSGDIEFLELSPKPNDFPTPHVRTMKSLRQRYDELQSSFRNVDFLGTFSDGENFFLHENLIAAHRHIDRRLDDL